MPLFEIIYIQAHQSPKSEIDSSRVLAARDAVDAVDIYKRRLKGVKKRKLLSVSALPDENLCAVWDCLLTGQNTDIDRCLRTKSSMSGACKECHLGIEKSGGN